MRGSGQLTRRLISVMPALPARKPHSTNDRHLGRRISNLPASAPISQSTAVPGSRIVPRVTAGPGELLGTDGWLPAGENPVSLSPGRLDRPLSVSSPGSGVATAGNVYGGW